ncbi:uncharacterized protein LOC127535823 [Acanthochromis polyacanthus]|uniref:uncharacterized protein LOC127532276 n=1 Tax=Acanthochromis polyacanthus TaxID=80966 RepID=UPI0022341E6C|nr:uncharacterized protein LOC127532276 [Acanthochromis polyacanthus]XP_051810663.1 uncharacterized protein LOC127535823 [Acanthochromis polyacanthus]
MVPCLLDSGSMVTTITESYFNDHFSHWSDMQLKDCNWLGLKAANGLNIPYLGYIELDLHILGVCLPCRGVLIVKDPTDSHMRQKKLAVPGVLGMNVFNPLYYELLRIHGPDLWEAAVFRSAPTGLRKVLRCCQVMEAMTSSPDPHPVRVQDFCYPFVLEVDASHEGLGAVLSQEQGGKLRPIAFASRSLKPTERNMNNYSSMKLELVALKWAVTEKFREYLLGNKCTVYTDNNPLSHLATAKLGATEQRWASELASFDLTLKYRPGSQNSNADALSRLHPIIENGSLEEGEGVSGVLAEISALPGLEPGDLCTMQRQDPVIGSILKYWEQRRMPNSTERQELSKGSRELVRQWGRLRMKDSVLYRCVYSPDGGGSFSNWCCPSVYRSASFAYYTMNMGIRG